MGDAFSKVYPDVRPHVERALAAAGPHPPARNPFSRFLGAALAWTTAPFRGGAPMHPRQRLHPLQRQRRRHGDTVVYPNPGAPPDKLLVISRGRDRGRASRARLADLVSLALSRGWRVAVDEAKKSDAESVIRCAVNAATLLPSTRTCLVGVASGARAACMASVSCPALERLPRGLVVPVPLVSIPDGRDTEPDFWADYAEAPALLIDFPGETQEACGLAAKDNALVATVTAPRRDYCHSWANRVALEFLESVIRL